MIERIYVHNYRCFENFTLDLKGRPSALIIGKNGAGKSTLRHALGVLQAACRGMSGVMELLSPSDFSHHRIELPIRFEVGVVLGGRRIEYKLFFEWSDGDQRIQVQGEGLEVDGQSVFSRQRDAVTLPDRTTFSIDHPGTVLSLVREKDAGGSVQRFRDFFRSALLLSPVPSGMFGSAEAENNELKSHAGNFSGWLNTLLTRQPARYASMVKYLQAVMPDLTSFEFVPVGEQANQLRVQFENVGTGDDLLPLNFDRLSDGEKCFFLSAAVVAFIRKDTPLFCFWDEPDNHLAPAEVGHFVTELRRMTNNGGQFLATSHHPETIRRFSGENTLVFTRNSHLEPTVVRPLSEIGYHGDLVSALLRGEVIE